MPIARYQPQVNQVNLPNPAQTPIAPYVEKSLADAKLGNSMASVGEALVDRQIQVQREDSELEKQTIINDYRSKITEIERVALQAKGSQAVGLSDRVKSELEKQRYESLDKATNDKVRQSVDNYLQYYGNSAWDTAARHENTQKEVYKKDTLKSTVANDINYITMAGDKDAAIKTSMSALIDQVQGFNMPQEEAALYLKETEKTYYGAAVTALSVNDPVAARKMISDQTITDKNPHGIYNDADAFKLNEGITKIQMDEAQGETSKWVEDNFNAIDNGKIKIKDMPVNPKWGFDAKDVQTLKQYAKSCYATDKSIRDANKESAEKAEYNRLIDLWSAGKLTQETIRKSGASPAIKLSLATSVSEGKNPFNTNPYAQIQLISDINNGDPMASQKITEAAMSGQISVDDYRTLSNHAKAVSEGKDGDVGQAYSLLKNSIVGSSMLGIKDEPTKMFFYSNAFNQLNQEIAAARKAGKPLVGSALLNRAQEIAIDYSTQLSKKAGIGGIDMSEYNTFAKVGGAEIKNRKTQQAQQKKLPPDIIESRLSPDGRTFGKDRNGNFRDITNE